MIRYRIYQILNKTKIHPINKIRGRKVKLRGDSAIGDSVDGISEGAGDVTSPDKLSTMLKTNDVDAISPKEAATLYLSALKDDVSIFTDHVLIFGP